MKIVINPDKDFVREMKTALKANNGFCPCALEKSKDTKCMCKDFRDKVRNGYIGECNCGLYKSI